MAVESDTPEDDVEASQPAEVEELDDDDGGDAANRLNPVPVGGFRASGGR